jgi:hypothetical protein
VTWSGRIDELARHDRSAGVVADLGALSTEERLARRRKATGVGRALIEREPGYHGGGALGD